MEGWRVRGREMGRLEREKRKEKKIERKRKKGRRLDRERERGRKHGGGERRKG